MAEVHTGFEGAAEAPAEPFVGPAVALEDAESVSEPSGTKPACVPDAIKQTGAGGVGTCIPLSGETMLYTAEHGSMRARDLEGAVVTAIAFDLDTHELTSARVRIGATRGGEAFAFGNGLDGLFVAPAEASVVTESGRLRPVGALRIGERLRVASARLFPPQYVRLSYSGKKEQLHRLVAREILGADVENMHVHHRDGDGLNNAPENLDVLPPSEHARHHVLEKVAAGEHVFQQRSFPKKGKANPMHRDADFWKDEEKAAAYRDAKRAEMMERDPRALQEKAILQRYFNQGAQLLDAGHDISTLRGFFRAYEIVIGRVDSKPRRASRFDKVFGSYEAYYAQLMEVYDEGQ